MEKSIFLTFDIEEWPLSKANYITKLSEEGCKKIIKLLKAYDIKSTFFVTGTFAKSEKKVIKIMLLNDHEIGCHGYSHENLTRIEMKELEKKLKSSKEIIEKIVGKKIIGFRAPYLKINNSIFRILNNLKYKYDSSIQPHIFNFNKYNFYGVEELPISVFPFLRLPISWYWMRNLGTNWTSFAIKNILKKDDVILFFHSWEFVNISRTKKLFYIKRNTGKACLEQLKELLENFKYKNFGKLQDLVRK